MTEPAEENDPATALGEVKIISGRPYRTGFLAAFFWALRQKSISPLLRQRQMRENYFSSATKLYHYTSLAGLQGIITSGGFWASDSRFLNDAEEMKDGTRLICRVLDAYRQRLEGDPFAGVLSVASDQIASQAESIPLVASFSEARDSLEQWRAYCREGGVCIEVEVRPEASVPLFFLPDQMPMSVTYRALRKAKIVASILKRYQREYAVDRSAMAGWWPDNHDAEYARRLGWELDLRVAIFKNASFEQEREVRLVIPTSAADRFGGLSFRSTPIGLVPYVNTGGSRPSAREHPLPITEVLVGPSARQDLLALSVRTFLDAMGYGQTSVVTSSVPYRG